MFKKAETAIQDIRYEDILDGYKLNVKSQVQSALTLVDYYYQQQLSGKLTESQAQEQAKEAVRALRYADDQGGYLWIDGTDYTLVMHPILREKEGSNRRELEDCNGVMIIQEIMKAAEAGGGFNEFVFTKSDGVTEAPKIAYSEAFEPWNWVLTTGCYSDDINDNIAISENNAQINNIFDKCSLALIIESILLIIVMMLLSVFVITRMVKLLEIVKGKLENVSNGDLTGELDSINSIITDLVKRFEECTDCIEQVVNSNQINISDTNEVIKAFKVLDQGISVTGEKVVRINAVLANTLNEIEAVSSQAAEIERGAESSAAASQEVTASSEELAALMNSIGNSTDTLNTEAEGLVEKLNAFTV